MKTLFIAIFFISLNCFSQTKYITKTGELSFEASVAAFEEVAATNNSVTAILNSENGEFATLALVKAFRFKNALMEEHFNENYAESNTFPKATFKGVIEKFSTNNISSSKKSFKINGQLTFHGVTKTINKCDVTIVRNENDILLEGNFIVLASDFGIEIPSIVRNKIAQDILIHFLFKLSK